MFPPNTSRPLSLGGAVILPTVTGGTPLTHTVTPRVPLQAAAGHDMPTQAPAIWGAGSPLLTFGKAHMIWRRLHRIHQKMRPEMTVHQLLI